MPNRLEEVEVLRANLDAVLAGPAISTGATNWYTRLASFLAEAKDAVPSKLKERRYLIRLWDENPVAAIGNGTVKISPALDDVEFVDWFAEKILTLVQEDRGDAESQLTAFYNELSHRLGDLCGRTPRLKINRVLSVFFPKYFTTIADVGALSYLHREMGGSRKDHPVHAHISVRRRIDQVLGPVDGTDTTELVKRMCLPWMLYERMTSDKPAEVSAPDENKKSQLTPLPAVLRRKGLTAMKGGYQTLLSLLPALDDGVTRDELNDLILQANPDLSPQSISPFINVVAREFDLCVREGDVYRLSARGINLLESQDASDLADHLLTRVLGVDNVIRELAGGPKPKTELVNLLKKVNPGWTSDFAPTALLGWLTSLGVLTITPNRQFQLSDMGHRWNEMVTWEPEALPKPAETIEELQTTIEEKVELPAWAELSARLETIVAGRLRFDDDLVRQLHAGLWFHPVRHFAVLTGISGSGKTQLALNYALALCGEQAVGQETVKVVPVQPGWFDPSPLLGYVNPIQQSAYRSAPFLEILLRAYENPSVPYVAILDEMNLSHPEQYLAPILSAMETHGTIDLHQLADGTTEIPKSIRYPANLAIIGTVNMDETTHGLSDKVLDRAFTLEFWRINVSDFPRWQNSGLSQPLQDKARVVLEALGQALAPVRLHFGWRTIDDVINYLVFAIGIGASETRALDDALYAKVMPKLRGEGSKRFEDALQAARNVAKEYSLVRCSEKLGAMQADLTETGTTRFWR